MRLAAFDKLNLFIRTYITMFGNVIRFSSWSPFLYLAIFQLLGIVLMAWISMPGWKNFIYPILSLAIPTELFHFPEYLLVIPHIFSDFDNYILGPTAWVIFSAVAVYKLGGLYSNEKLSAKTGFSIAFRSFLPLLIVWFIELALVFVLFKASTVLLIEFIYGSPKRVMALNVTLQLIAFIPSAFLVYAVPGIILNRMRVINAIGHSLKLCYQNFFMTYFIILIPGLVRLGFDIIIKDFGPKIAFSLNPNLIIVFMVMKVVAGIFINLFILGVATYIYRDLTGKN
ncbi:MAG: hypothetical protein GY839_01505 [candidate division Zixibacteria bacterium]|nr:hypothetical protein [candidate division Zixibacteria bacterium]